MWYYPYGNYGNFYNPWGYGYGYGNWYRPWGYGYGYGFNHGFRRFHRWGW